MNHTTAPRMRRFARSPAPPTTPRLARQRAERRRFWGLQALACALGLCLSPSALPAPASSASAHYPNQAITLLVPFSGPSDSDFFARTMAMQIRPLLKNAQFLIENRTQEEGVQAAIDTKNAAPDGYTLMAARISTQALAPALKPSLPYRWNDFTLLGVLEIAPLVCAVRPDAPYTDTRMLLRVLRQSPGTLRYGHLGQGTSLNLTVQYLMKLGGLKPDSAQGMHFETTNDAIAALSNSQIDFLCAPAGSMVGAALGKKIWPLFTTFPGRLGSLPALKTAREIGFADLERINSGTLLVGPPRLPQGIVLKWRAALGQLTRDPVWLEALEQRQSTSAIGSLKDNTQFIKDQALFYQQLVGLLGL